MTDTITQHAQVQWDSEGQPISSQFGDVYFSRANGLDETRHVFLQHNHLAERWQALDASQHFTIAETGFGSGLNFLAAWQLWLTVAPPGAQLHFVSVEKYPLTKEDLARALALWPELSSLSELLLANYPVFMDTDFHRLNFCNGRIKLTLIIDDATEGFRKLLLTPDPYFSSRCALVDAWFLDGFAPARNPQMWSPELFSCIQRLSHSNTTAATFSAAAIVKQGLIRAGFNIQKVPGFGRKRDMVKAIQSLPKTLINTENVSDSEPALIEPSLHDSLTAQPQPPDNHESQYPNPKYLSYSPYPVPWTLVSHPVIPKFKEAIIIGGGLAGCTSARALAERGWKITLLEQHSRLAEEGSGNPQGVLYAKLSHKTETQAEFNLACLLYAFSFYQPLWPKIGEQCGVLQLAYCDSELKLHEQLREKFSDAKAFVDFVDANQASALAGVPLQHPALYFPLAGWINPPSVCTYVTQHPNIQVIYRSRVSAITQQTDGWKVHCPSAEHNAPIVIIANARDAREFPQTQSFPIKSIRGQISFVPQTSTSRLLRTVVCSEGYIGPAVNAMHCTGATFNLKENTPLLRPQDHQTNLENLRAPLPDILDEWRSLDIDQLQGRVGFRCTLPDYLPMTGPIPDEQPMLEDFAPLRKNARAYINKTGSYLPGLYINIGHGSRGLAYTPLCAELLAAQINNEPLPINRNLANALNPARFLIRDLIKNKR